MAVENFCCMDERYKEISSTPQTVIEDTPLLPAKTHAGSFFRKPVDRYRG